MTLRLEGEVGQQGVASNQDIPILTIHAWVWSKNEGFSQAPPLVLLL